MLAPITKKIVNYSDKKQFSFAFFCDRCGKEWRSVSQPFSKMAFAEFEHDEARLLLWIAEHDAAYERANVEAMFRFSRCPGCKQFVCDECFHTTDGEITDICLDCLGKQEA